LPIKNWVGEDYHEIQFREEIDEPIQFARTAIGVYDWLLARVHARGGIPTGMPDVYEGLSVVTFPEWQRRSYSVHALGQLCLKFERSTSES
jgi:hypothetical protein